MKKTLNEQDIHKIKKTVISRLIKEGYVYDGEDDDYQEMDPVEEYEKGYPNGGFDPKSVDETELLNFCKNIGDFLYIIKDPFRGWRISAANSEPIQQEIMTDILNCAYVEPSHEMDYLITQREREFMYDYVCVMKIHGTPDGDYYVVYQKRK